MGCRSGRWYNRWRTAPHDGRPGIMIGMSPPAGVQIVAAIGKVEKPEACRRDQVHGGMIPGDVRCRSKVMASSAREPGLDIRINRAILFQYSRMRIRPRQIGL